jgi:hypothetical protein
MFKNTITDLTNDMQRLDKHPAIRASNNTTNVYISLLGKNQRANGLPR